jgi:hypothetical protein
MHPSFCKACVANSQRLVFPTARRRTVGAVNELSERLPSSCPTTRPPSSTIRAPHHLRCLLSHSHWPDSPSRIRDPWNRTTWGAPSSVSGVDCLTVNTSTADLVKYSSCTHPFILTPTGHRRFFPRYSSLVCGAPYLLYSDVLTWTPRRGRRRRPGRDEQVSEGS